MRTVPMTVGLFLIAISFPILTGARPCEGA